MNTENPRFIHAPFSGEQIDGLNKYQHAGAMHPFTCGRRDQAFHPPEAVLVATERGWTCPHCDYTQDWAWEWMSIPSYWPSLFGELG